MCDTEIKPGIKYLAVFQDLPNGGIRVEVGCDHFHPLYDKTAIAVLGGGNCAMEWFSGWLAGLQERECRHD